MIGRLGAWMFAVCLFGCSSPGGGEPCERLCDGIVRCRQGNETCVAQGMTGRDPFYGECMAECEATSAMLTPEEVDSAMLCLECLDGATNFESCNGEMLLDVYCATTCRAGGAIPFRDRFGPELFDSLMCVANPRS
jgi:hypothetical protein